MAPLHERDPPFRHEPADVALAYPQVLGHLTDCEQARQLADALVRSGACVLVLAFHAHDSPFNIRV